MIINKNALNKNAIRIETPMYLPAEEYTLDEAINSFIFELEKRAYSLYNTVIEKEEALNKSKDITVELAQAAENIKKNMYSFRFFTNISLAPKQCFHTSFYNYQFDINPKNINLDITITDIKDRYIMNNAIPEQNCGPAEKIIDNPLTQRKVFALKYIPNWENLWGEGHFPNLRLVLVRLGNNEYYMAEYTKCCSLIAEE